MTTAYQIGGSTVTIGQSQELSLPPRIFRGHATCMHFETDKSFLLPPSVSGVRNIVLFHHRHAGMTVLVNGHTDLVGDSQYNLQLSNERAKTVSAYLMNDIDTWMAWYDNGTSSKRWSYREDQFMLSTVTDGTGAPYYGGPITGSNDNATQSATSRFQTDNGLKMDGQLGPNTRRILIGKYMALEGTSLPADTHLLSHGCGRFHPIEATNQASLANRRVEIFLFDGDPDPPIQEPCPSPGCTSYPAWVAAASENIDLCQAQPTLSNPRWEDVDATPLSTLSLALYDWMRRPCPDRPVTVLVGALRIFTVTDSHGILRTQIPSGASSVRVRYTPNDITNLIELAVKLNLPDASTNAGAVGRLVNLGYPAERDLSASVSQFQRDFGVAVSGKLDAPTQARLVEVHDP